jgi:hypothetical protein
LCLVERLQKSAPFAVHDFAVRDRPLSAKSSHYDRQPASFKAHQNLTALRQGEEDG